LRQPSSAMRKREPMAKTERLGSASMTDNAQIGNR
jgi:hypothetical protein